MLNLANEDLWPFVLWNVNHKLYKYILSGTHFFIFDNFDHCLSYGWLSNFAMIIVMFRAIQCENNEVFTQAY